MLLLTGCGGQEVPAAAPASSPAVAAPSPTELPPTDAVKAALQRLTTSTYSYTVTGDYWYGQKYHASGTHDSPAGKDSRTVVISGGEEAGTCKLIVIGDDTYENCTGSGRWVHADLTRLKPTSDYYLADPKDSGGVARLMAALHSARRLGPGKYEGEARLEVTAGLLTYVPVGAPYFRFERGGLWVSYTLTTDARGDVATIRTVFDTAKNTGVSTTTSFRNIGKPVQITKPARVTELRRSLYDK
ncbi:hypothetical protein [Paractinoplanes deccanensis]|uniref:hypothetical protein n=1 Tax=Paractinoplanes deccanensis TaxID=113561 RepID=UPI001943BB68|nr:hypothetical protein [Actinoplanes deccanensis]